MPRPGFAGVFYPSRKALPRVPITNNVSGNRLKVSDPGPGRGYRLVALQKHGAFVDIWSDLELEKLLELAVSLTPAPR
jgi:hypothetical protein